jgi:hypothetical protein
MLQEDDYRVWPNPICATLGMAVSAFASRQLKSASRALASITTSPAKPAWRRRAKALREPVLCRCGRKT